MSKPSTPQRHRLALSFACPVTAHRLWAGTLLLVLVSVLFLGTGCANTILAGYMVRAPNKSSSKDLMADKKFLAFADTAYAEQHRVKVGRPLAELSVAVIEPGDYKLVYSVALTPEPKNMTRVEVNLNFQPRQASPAFPAPLGTLVLLHGIMLRKESMLPWALYLAQHGYRVVLVDFRGHGRSSGDWITYGALEAGDLVQVADLLEKRGLLSGPFGVMGISYGASIGIEWAARDARVGTVIALQPFSDPRQAIIQYSRGCFYEQTKSLSDEAFASAQEKARRLARFRWEDADVLAAAGKLKVPVLFFHGAADTWIPPVHSETIKGFAPRGSELRLLPKVDHMAMTLLIDPLAADVLSWFGSHLGKPVLTATHP